MSANVLVTGASSGFGYGTVCRLARRGHRVFATMRASQDRNATSRRALEELTSREGLALEVLEMDVLDEASVNACVQEAFARAGHLDVVVNNAGIASLGLAEAFTPEQYLHVYDANVAGVVRVNRAVLPVMRQRRSGLLIHISSAAGRLVVPALGPYCASKFALEAVADAFRYELAPWGVQSVLLEPGIYRTPIIERAVTPADRERVDEFGAAGSYVEQVNAVFAAAMADPTNPGSDEVAEAIVQLVEMTPADRPFRTVLSPPIVPVLQPYNEIAEGHRAVVASIFGVEHLLSLAPSGNEEERPVAPCVR